MLMVRRVVGEQPACGREHGQRHFGDRLLICAEFGSLQSSIARLACSTTVAGVQGEMRAAARWSRC
jgi:hypothetical protein